MCFSLGNFLGEGSLIKSNLYWRENGLSNLVVQMQKRPQKWHFFHEGVVDPESATTKAHFSKLNTSSLEANQSLRCNSKNYVVMQLDIVTIVHALFCHFISTILALSSKRNYYKNWKELALLLGHNQSLLLCLVIS